MASMTAHDRLNGLSQRITALTGQTISGDQLVAVADQAFKQQIDLDDDGQLRALVAELAAPLASGGPAVAGISLASLLNRRTPPRPCRPPRLPPRRPGTAGCDGR